MKFIEIAIERGWGKLWIECDFALVVAAYKSFGLVPWGLRNKINFINSHIYREGNCCADKLANYGFY